MSYNTDNNLIKVLQDVSLEVDHKDTVSIVGESGSGKTSLIMLIGGLEKATSGKIQFKEFEISNLNEDQISDIRRKNIGIIFQSFQILLNLQQKNRFIYPFQSRTIRIVVVKYKNRIRVIRSLDFFHPSAYFLYSFLHTHIS